MRDTHITSPLLLHRATTLHDFLHSERTLLSFCSGEEQREKAKDKYGKFTTRPDDMHSDVACEYISMVGLCVRFPQVKNEDRVCKWCRLTLQWWTVHVIKEFLQRFEGDCTTAVTQNLQYLKRWQYDFQQTCPPWALA